MADGSGSTRVKFVKWTKLSEDKGKKDDAWKEYDEEKTKLETKGTKPPSGTDGSGKGGGGAGKMQPRCGGRTRERAF